MPSISMILGIALLIVVGAFGAYFKYSQDTIATLEQDKAKLTVAVDLQKKTIEDMKAQFAQQAGAITDLQKSMNANTSAQMDLQRKLQTHNLNKAAGANPADIEARINKGTANAFGDLESFTSGKPPTPPTVKP
ncbi:hypothetical protein UFOVP29_31 [uncultured Caudovirales phage]|uniref:Uncharacterized protein n=1 Tax=uncultured Caudovirales phage TaxID=2100421 RepID=A0A6J5KK06_9CAUD|nr:hypothetical protein UFOVP29_31 [uncultured Caudovirales phage]